MTTGANCAGRTLAGIVRGTNFTISGGSGAAIGLTASFQMEFQRKITRVYDLASPIFYYIEGASEGRVQFSKIIGPAGAPKLACDCTVNDIILNAGPTICPVGTEDGVVASASDFSYTLKNAIPFGLSGQGDSENFLISFSISYLFNDVQ